MFDSVSDRMCGYYSPSEHLTFISSGNVMLVTMATNDELDFPGFRAQVSQIKRGSRGEMCWFNPEPARHFASLTAVCQLFIFCLDV